VKDGLRLRVKRQSAWQDVPLAYRHASIEISTTNPRCSGDYLKAQVDWARGRFADFQFAIGDTLQLHNYVILGHPDLGIMSEEKARKQCLDEGDAWIDANKSLIADLATAAPVRLRRWTELLATRRVVENLANLTMLYESDPHTQNLIRRDVLGYVERRHSRMLQVLDESQLARLDRHVLEELAVYQYQVESRNLISIYPGTSQLILRPQNLAASNLPEQLKARHYVTVDIQADRSLALAGVST